MSKSYALYFPCELQWLKSTKNVSTSWNFIKFPGLNQAFWSWKETDLLAKIFKEKTHLLKRSLGNILPYKKIVARISVRYKFFGVRRGLIYYVVGQYRSRSMFFSSVSSTLCQYTLRFAFLRIDKISLFSDILPSIKPFCRS